MRERLELEGGSGATGVCYSGATPGWTAMCVDHRCHGEDQLFPRQISAGLFRIHRRIIKR